MAARLEALGVPALIIEANDRIGDNWRKRYESLSLHFPVWQDHLPYIPFPRQWPVYTPAGVSQTSIGLSDILFLPQG